MFPALKDGQHSRAGQGEKHHVSHAKAFRRDLRRAFGIDAPDLQGKMLVWHQARELTPRETVLFEGDAHTLPVDFHSWRRAYCQSLADAGVNVQLARVLAGHSTESAHQRYLQSSERARELPEAARPKIDLSKAIRQKI